MKKPKLVPKKTRIEIYKKIKEVFELPYNEGFRLETKRGKYFTTMYNDDGFCCNITELFYSITGQRFDYVKHNVVTSTVLDCFPEIKKFRPQGISDGEYWFSEDFEGYKKRKEIINQICDDIK